MDNAILQSTTDTMLEKLLTVDQTKELLAPTEGLAEYEFATDGDTNKVHFNFPYNWNEGLEEKEDFAITDATIDIDGTELRLTKVGALDLIGTVSFSKAAAIDTPNNIVQDYLNYHYNNGARGKKSLKVLASDLGVLSTTRGTVTPYSSSALLDAIVAGIADRGYGTDDLRIDYKWNHGLDLTNLRVIIPSAIRNIGSARAERAGDDPWSLGIELNNSINGKHSLEEKGYLFAWWCTNGATIERASSGKYRRKQSVTPEETYEWARRITDDVFNDLDREFDAIEQLTKVSLEGELNDTVGRLFERFGVSDSARESVMRHLVDNDDLTAYGLMNSVTQAANNEELSAAAVNNLLSAGGEIAHVMSEQCEVCHRF